MSEAARTVRGWVVDVAYAEDDFVLSTAEGEQMTGTPTEVIRLLDALDPDWRSVFTTTPPPNPSTTEGELT
jgi:hypothetical protein